MSQAIVAIYNLALDAIGARNRVSMPTENSREAEACNLWFPNIRDQVLASARWPEATKIARLGQLATQADDTWTVGDPAPAYTYAYALPPDCLRPQYLSDFGRFVIQHYTPENRALMTNTYSPLLTYTFRQEVIPLWSPELKMAIVYGLAASICASLTGKPSRSKTLIALANENILLARQTAANTDNEVLDALPEWISARGFTDGSANTRYFYPYGSLLVLTANVS